MTSGESGECRPSPQPIRPADRPNPPHLHASSRQGLLRPRSRDVGVHSGRRTSAVRPDQRSWSDQAFPISKSCRTRSFGCAEPRGAKLVASNPPTMRSRRLIRSPRDGVVARYSITCLVLMLLLTSSRRQQHERPKHFRGDDRQLLSARRSLCCRSSVKVNSFQDRLSVGVPMLKDLFQITEQILSQGRVEAFVFHPLDQGNLLRHVPFAFSDIPVNLSKHFASGRYLGHGDMPS